MRSLSSAKDVAYDLRPAKQCERRIMVDCLLTATESGFELSSYRYVGMGGNRFYDFRMMHKYLGMARMVSLEHDEAMFRRAAFNRPFGFVEVEKKSVGDFLLNDRSLGGTVYWLDYDASIERNIADDVVSLGANAAAGDFVFVTIDARLPRHLRRERAADRLAELKESLGDLAVSLDTTDVEDSRFPETAQKVLSWSIKRGFRHRKDGVFRMFFRVGYRDTAEMVTLGGVFDGSDRAERFLDRLKKRIPFLSGDPQDVYRIGQFNYTEKERRLLDRAATANRKNAREVGELRKLGFDQKEINQYGELLRYHPRYVETFV